MMSLFNILVFIPPMSQYWAPAPGDPFPLFTSFKITAPPVGLTKLTIKHTLTKYVFVLIFYTVLKISVLM